MNVLVLTQTLNKSSGWGRSSSGLINALEKIYTDIKFDVYTGDNRKNRIFGKDALISTINPKLYCLPCLFDAINVLLSRKKQYELIHILTEQYAVTGMILAKLLKIPYVITAHGTYSVLLPFKHKIFRCAFEKANAVIANSNYTRTRMLEEGINAPIEVVTLGIDKNRFSFDSSIKRTNSITFIGNTKTRKGLRFLLESFKKASQNNGKMKLKIIGGINTASEECLKLKSYIKDNALNVEFLGKVSEGELIRCYQQARLNVLPSNSERFAFEGFGLVHLESNACGTLTVGTYNSGNEDAITTGCGYLVKYGDVDGLSQIISDVMHLEKYPSLKVASLPSWEDVAAEYKILYEKVIK